MAGLGLRAADQEARSNGTAARRSQNEGSGNADVDHAARATLEQISYMTDTLEVKETDGKSQTMSGDICEANDVASKALEGEQEGQATSDHADDR